MMASCASADVTSTIPIPSLPLSAWLLAAGSLTWPIASGGLVAMSGRWLSYEQQVLEIKKEQGTRFLQLPLARLALSHWPGLKPVLILLPRSLSQLIPSLSVDNTRDFAHIGAILLGPWEVVRPVDVAGGQVEAVGGDSKMNTLIWYGWLGGVIIGTMIGANTVLEAHCKVRPHNIVITGSTRGLGKALAHRWYS
ncbi:hypothetical protein GUJ93_ZPchr0011g27165 [Zizania palustris]|uniref:Uncharacterized protein n=1 Tax=Zizania palustris TaxID=103762 RepID=A0A8J6BNP1_ZIZPA|nr:hypothetical protein GUJ93_ZPchr0011g27165 [Zizania palustris]